MALLDIRQRALRQAERLTQTDQVRAVVSIRAFSSTLTV